VNRVRGQLHRPPSPRASRCSFRFAAVARFYAALERDGVRVASGAWFGDAARVFRLGFGFLDIPDLQDGLEKLSAALRSTLDDMA
jgi:DNA-binding transcriptional MocR family regulator